MIIAMQDKRVLKILLWLLAVATLFAGLAIDHKYGGSRPPSGVHSDTMVMPNASSPT